MTGFEGNRQMYSPREIFGEGILNLKGQIDSPLPEGQSLFVLLYHYVKRTLNEKTMIFLIESLLDLRWF